MSGPVRYSALPAVLLTACAFAAAPGEIRLYPENVAVTAGREAVVTVTADIATADSGVTVLPIALPAVDWGALRLLSMESAFEEDRLRITQRLAAAPRESGDFTLPALPLAVLRKPDGKAETLLQTPETAVTVYPDRVFLLWLLPGLALVTGGILAGGLRVRRARRAVAAAAAETEHAAEAASEKEDTT
jgi:hypothetical protein